MVKHKIRDQNVFDKFNLNYIFVNNLLSCTFPWSLNWSIIKFIYIWICYKLYHGIELVKLTPSRYLKAYSKKEICFQCQMCYLRKWGWARLKNTFQSVYTCTSVSGPLYVLTGPEKYRERGSTAPRKGPSCQEGR